MNEQQVDKAEWSAYKATTCTEATGHLSGQPHRWQDCPTYQSDDEE